MTNALLAAAVDAPTRSRRPPRVSPRSVSAAAAREGHVAGRMLVNGRAYSRSALKNPHRAAFVRVSRVDRAAWSDARTIGYFARRACERGLR